MEKLYRKLKMGDGGKVYAPTVRGRRSVLLFKSASAAQARSLAVRARYKRLKAAEEKAKG
jgi:hypothetical protein